MVCRVYNFSRQLKIFSWEEIIVNESLFESLDGAGAVDAAVDIFYR
jgi:hypothetical protein